MVAVAQKFTSQADLHRTFAGELSQIERDVFAICIAAASENRPLDSTEEIMGKLNLGGFSTVPGVLLRLEQKGMIARTVYQKGRQVRIIATGQCTAAPANTAPHWRNRDRSEDPPVPAIHLVREKAQSAAMLIEQEARRLGKPMTDFLADLVYIGWAEYLDEQGREAA
jgi:hypothetical protein